MSILCVLLAIVAGTFAITRQLIVGTRSLRDLDTAATFLREEHLPCLDPAWNVTIRRQYAIDIFPGLAISVTSEDQVFIHSLKNCINALPQVTRVWTSHEYGLATSETELPSYPKHSDPYLLHHLTGVDKLHDLGIKGKGIRIAVIDEGVDYLHPAFDGGIGENFTIQYGFDFAGDAYSADHEPKHDPNPYSECSFHGTHVTGIVAGSQPGVGFVGVAPEAVIEHYKITGCDDSSPLRADVVVDALLTAHSRGVDVITMSLDSRTGPFDDDVVAEVLGRIVREDKIVCVVSAGNEGAKGPFSSTAPAATHGVLSVGSVNSEHVVHSIPRARYASDGENNWYGLPWSPATPSRFPERFPLYSLAAKADVEREACVKLESELRLEDKLVLIRRGGCLLETKMRHVAERGARYVLFFDNELNASHPFKFDRIPELKGAGSTTAESGRRLLSLLQTGRQVVMMMDSNFTLPPFIEVDHSHRSGAGMISGRGSWGPSGSLEIRPSLLAPGWNVWSTVPRSWGGYDTYSGTSMAAPYIAGCAALLRQLEPKLTAGEIVRRISSTSQPLRFHDGTEKPYEFLAPAWQQGSGLVDMRAALRSRTAVSMTSISFNDTENMIETITFQLINNADEPVTYELTSEPSVTVLTFSTDDLTGGVPWTRKKGSSKADKEFLRNLLPPSKHAYISVDPSTVIMPAHSSINVSVTADITDLRNFSSHCPLYSGFIYISSSLEERLSIPYGGVACAMSKINVLPRVANTTFLSSCTFAEVEEGGDFGPKPINPGKHFVLPPPKSSPPSLNSTTRYPTVILQPSMYTPQVEVGLDGINCESSDCLIASYPARENTGRPGGFSPVVTSHLLWRGQLQNGSWADGGCYTFQICAARIWSTRRDCLKTSRFCFEYEK